MTDIATDAQRVFDRRQVWHLAAEVFALAATMLASAADQRYGPVSTVIAVAHGGVPLATILADTLGVARLTVRARHNRTGEHYEQATGQVMVDTSDLAAHLRGHRMSGTVLLVDDICGSAATLTAVQTALTPHLTPHARVVTAVLCRNTGAAQDPDLWLWEVSDWVIFPWETPPMMPSVALPTPTCVRSR